MAPSESLELRLSRSGKSVEVVLDKDQKYIIRDKSVREQTRVALQQYIDDEKIDNSFEFFAHLYPKFYQTMITTAHNMKQANAVLRLSKRWQPWYKEYMDNQAGELLSDAEIDDYLLSQSEDPIGEDLLAFEGVSYANANSDLLHGKPHFAKILHFRDADGKIDVIEDEEDEEEENMDDGASSASSTIDGSQSDISVEEEERTENDVDFHALANYIGIDTNSAPTDLSAHLIMPGLSQQIESGSRAAQVAVAQMLTSNEFNKELDKAEWTLGDNSAALWAEQFENDLQSEREFKLTSQGIAKLESLELEWNGSTTGDENNDNVLEVLDQLTDGVQTFRNTPIVQSMVRDGLISYQE